MHEHVSNFSIVDGPSGGFRLCWVEVRREFQVGAENLCGRQIYSSSKLILAIRRTRQTESTI